jgi:hypothetical protein
MQINPGYGIKIPNQVGNDGLKKSVVIPTEAQRNGEIFGLC